MQNYPSVGREEQYLEEQRKKWGPAPEHNTAVGILIGILKFLFVLLLVAGCVVANGNANKTNLNKQDQQQTTGE
jgi:hypothetical protein